MDSPHRDASEMARYIEIDKYNAYEEGHPGYQAMMDQVVRSTVACVGHCPAQILEIGSGTGNYTWRIGAQQNTHVTAVEIDQECSRYLRHKINSGEIQNTTLVTQDFREWAAARPDHAFAAVNTTFTDHHFSPGNKPGLLAQIARLLKDGGEYVLGDEFLPPHDETDPAARVTAQLQYHGMVIEEAFKEGKVELPKLELDALISGLRTTVRFIQETAPGKAQEDFRVQASPENGFNAPGVTELHALIARLKAVDSNTLENPEQLPEDTLPEKRQEVIAKLEALAQELTESRRPGLEEDAARGMVGGDYKMTLQQYTQFLREAGFEATGYFEGPKAVGTSTDVIDHGTGEHPVALHPDENHDGGVWVVRARLSKQQETGAALSA